MAGVQVRGWMDLRFIFVQSCLSLGPPLSLAPHIIVYDLHTSLRRVI